MSSLEKSNPLWAATHNERSDPDYVRGNVVPAVNQMAIATDLPQEIAQYKPQLQLMSQLYDDYQREVAKHNSPLARDESARQKLASTYSKRGDEMFKGTPVESLWNTMKVYE